MDISVVVPTLNRDVYLADTLTSLQQQCDVTLEIIVADQNEEAPEDRRPELLALSEPHEVRWTHCPGVGVVFARNLAISTARGRIVVFVDDDVRIDDPRFLARHMAAYAPDGDCSTAAVCGRETNPGRPAETDILPYERTDLLADILWFPRNYAHRVDVAVLSTANCSVKRDILIEVGCFDERFAGASYGDDSDLALRLHEAGHRIVYDPAPTLVHLMAGSGGLRLSDASRTAFSQSERVLSGVLFYLKHVHANYPRYRRYFIYHYILRKSLLLRSNVTHPWRLPAVTWGLLSAYRRARRELQSSHRCSFQLNNDSP
jgi:glycosyltransferase involved in cell wall biosynthesis